MQKIRDYSDNSVNVFKMHGILSSLRLKHFCWTFKFLVCRYFHENISLLQGLIFYIEVLSSQAFVMLSNIVRPLLPFFRFFFSSDTSSSILFLACRSHDVKRCPLKRQPLRHRCSICLSHYFDNYQESWKEIWKQHNAFQVSRHRNAKRQSCAATGCRDILLYSFLWEKAIDSASTTLDYYARPPWLVPRRLSSVVLSNHEALRTLFHTLYSLQDQAFKFVN